MAKYTKTDPKTGKKSTDNPFEFEYKKDYEEDWNVHKNYIQSFDAYEAMLIGTVYDSVSMKIDNSKITDSYATTLAKERADRVIAKLPDGVTESAGKADVGKAMFMDILRQKWIYPNANAQHPFLEKINMWQLYSSVYGYMPMFYDWNVAPSGYVGPDCWLWNPRNLVPQQGRTSIADMEYVTALTWLSKKKLENIRDNLKDGDGWNKEALDMLIGKASDQKTDPDADQDTFTERERITTATKKGICLATRYEAGEDGKWCTFAPDHSYIEVRKIKNPHKNGRIPFVIKYSQPLFDSFYGLGDFQRGKALQFARDGATNFYFKGVKNSLIPPIVANANGVIKHTLDYRPGGVILETLPNSVRTLEVSSGGLATYQAVMQSLTGQLLAQYGSQNAALPAADALNPSQGRTPAAIDLYSDKEATRDGAEMRHMEAALEQLFDGFFSLVVNIGTEDIPIALFYEDIEDIVKAGGQDLQELFFDMKARPDATGTAADLKINPKALKGVEYRFNITGGSTAKQNKEKELAGLERILGVIGKFQNIFKDDPRVNVNWPAILETYERLTDLKGANDFIETKDGPDPQELAMQQENAKLKQQMQQMQMEMQKHQMEMQQSQQQHQQSMEQSAQNQELSTAQQVQSMQPEPQTNTANAGGLYTDSDIASVAEQITKM